MGYKSNEVKERQTMKNLSEKNSKSEKVSVETMKENGRGNHPNSRANLKPWEKGVSGNPDGRPHKYVKFKESLDEYGSKLASAFDTQTNKEAVLEQIWYEARNGSISHTKILAELGCLDAE